MVRVFDKKMKKIMECLSVEKAFEGLQKGSYKVGEYLVIESSGKEHRFVKYICKKSK